MAIPDSFHILQAVIEATPDAIFVKDLDGRYVVVNAAAARFLGRAPEDIIGKHDLELYPEETARRFIADDQEVLASGHAMSFEGVATSDTATQAYLVTKGVYRDAAGDIRGIFGISHDVTELQQANEALEQTRDALFRAQKMEAVGQLTGGLAHDFNNIVSVIAGNLELLRMHLANDVRARELIDPVLRAAGHAQDLIANLLAFARRRQLQPREMDVNAVIEHVMRLIRRTLPARVHLLTELRADARTARVDQAAFEAALLNLVLNARDAMPDGGTVLVRTYRTEVSVPAGDERDPAPGTYTVVEVEDTGSGMQPDVVARVFEPFFTTKAAEGGTGLGLSMVNGFARSCDGAVTIASTPGRGTVVRLFLPLVSQPVAG